MDDSSVRPTDSSRYVPHTFWLSRNNGRGRSSVHLVFDRGFNPKRNFCYRTCAIYVLLYLFVPVFGQCDYSLAYSP
ncbi:hypothetical protein D3C77_641050 [compost metagenome]